MRNVCCIWLTVLFPMFALGQTHQLTLGLDYLNTTHAAAAHRIHSIADEEQWQNLGGARIRAAYSSPKYAPGLSLEISYQHLRMEKEGSREVFLFETRYQARTRVWFPELGIKYTLLPHYWVSPYVQLGLGKGIYKYQFTEADVQLGYFAQEGRYFKKLWYYPEAGIVFSIQQAHQIQLGFRSTFTTEFGSLPHISFGYAYAIGID